MNSHGVHDLTISNTAPPTRNRVPAASVFSSIPRVVVPMHASRVSPFAYVLGW